MDSSFRIYFFQMKQKRKPRLQGIKNHFLSTRHYVMEQLGILKQITFFSSRRQNIYLHKSITYIHSEEVIYLRYVISLKEIY